MGRWSSEVASLFLEWLQPSTNASWLDVGCGTGALTTVIAADTQPNQLIGADLSLDFLHYANRRIDDAAFINASTLALPVSNNRFDFVVSGLTLNFVPQPVQALSELVRTVKSGGMVPAYVWDYSEKKEFLRYFWDVALELNSDARLQHEGYRFLICHPDPLVQLWQDAGVRQVTVQALDAVSIFDTFYHYWKPVTLGNFPAPQYVSSLDDESRRALHDRLLSVLPTQPDGSIHLIARAWAVSGLK